MSFTSSRACEKLVAHGILSETCVFRGCRRYKNSFATVEREAGHYVSSTDSGLASLLIDIFCSRRVATDLSSVDQSKYKISIVPSSGSKTFHLGEPIVVKWEAPHNHSRKDWIGLYRVCLDMIVVSGSLLIICLLYVGWCEQVNSDHENVIVGDVGSRS